jgi:hypothetical protein
MVNNQENLERDEETQPLPREEKLPIYREGRHLKRRSWQERLREAFLPPRGREDKMFKRKVIKPIEEEEPKKDKRRGALETILFGSSRVSKAPKKEDTSIFRGKPHLKRSELRQKFKKASPYIPGTGGKMFKRKERLALLEKLLPSKKYGKFITPKKVKKAMKKFERSTWGKPHKERFQMEREIRYLKKHLGPERKK